MSSLPERDRLYLNDILKSGDAIHRYIDQHPDWLETRPSQTWEAILWNLAVIGEAAKRIGSETKRKLPDAGWAEAGRMRDFVVHHYSAIDRSVIAATIRQDIPRLLEAARGLLENDSES